MGRCQLLGHTETVIFAALEAGSVSIIYKHNIMKHTAFKNVVYIKHTLAVDTAHSNIIVMKQ